MFLVSPDKWPLLYFYTHICKNPETLFFWKWKYCCDGIISVSNILVPHLTAHVLSSTVFPVGWSDTEHTYNKCQYSDCHIKAWELLSVSFHPCFIRSHTVSAFMQGWTKWGCTQHTRFKIKLLGSSESFQAQQNKVKHEEGAALGLEWRNIMLISSDYTNPRSTTMLKSKICFSCGA